MALVRAGDTLRNDLISRFPAAIFYLEEGSFIHYLKKVMLTKDITLCDGTRQFDPLHFGDITYQTTQMQIVGAHHYEAYRATKYQGEMPERYEATTLGLTITMLSHLQKCLINRHDIPRALAANGIRNSQSHPIYFILIGLLNGDL
jgi:hypothetical protein